jgi:2-polyprenyl-3-methyl-5-hydroxy-6-metoxy-1,4-benzoquinol methylase
VLDVGCGTGLSSELLLQTDLSRLICHIDLLDTSEPMLAKVRDRAQKWGVPHATILGTIDAIPPSSQYDLIMACSVLHHIPDLKNRLRPAVRESYLELVNTSFIARTVIRKEGSSGESVGEFRGSARRLSEESVELAAGGVKGALVVFPAVVD